MILREKREVASHTTLQIPLPNQNPLVGTVAPRFRNKLSWQPLGSRSVLAESAIDALSHAALFPDAEDQTRYASLGGKPSARQTGLVQATIARLPEGAEIVAAFDADEVGRKLVDVMREAVASVAGRTERTDLIFKAHLPVKEGEDWNLILQHGGWYCTRHLRSDDNGRTGPKLDLPDRQPVR